MAHQMKRVVFWGKGALLYNKHVGLY